nr:AP2-associated protein kinase 1 isoform X1 [Tanacetum cinerariifolium]
VYLKNNTVGIEEDTIRNHTTLAYRSPEMWDLLLREVISEKINIWALGCLLFRIFYFKSAFDGKEKEVSMMCVLKAIIANLNNYFVGISHQHGCDSKTDVGAWSSALITEPIKTIKWFNCETVQEPFNRLNDSISEPAAMQQQLQNPTAPVFSQKVAYVPHMSVPLVLSSYKKLATPLRTSYNTSRTKFAIKANHFLIILVSHPNNGENSEMQHNDQS